MNCALWDKNGKADLYLTKELACSSILRPTNKDEIVETRAVFTSRADTILLVPETAPRHPEVVKIDVQGGELAVLEGFGDVLREVVCIETEVSFVQSYEQQPLMENIMQFLMRQGFGLIDVRVFGVRSTRAALQANAFFVRREVHTPRQAAVERVFSSVNRLSLAV
jgi:Methyltransferase FkbM domain